MPHVPAAENGGTSRDRSRQRARTEVGANRSMWNRLSFNKIGSWLKRDDDEPPSPTKSRPESAANRETDRPQSSGGLLHRRGSRKVVPGLPRPLTFKRMQSEMRDKLLEVPPEPEQRRATSADRKPSIVSKRTHSPTPISIPSASAPDVLSPHESDIHKQEQEREQHREQPTIGGGPDSNLPAGARQVDYSIENLADAEPAPSPPPLELEDSYHEHASHHSLSDPDDAHLQEELEAKWILNLSMHFRDMSDREKFFVTFAEERNKWRRVTVSCDYRHLEPDSLESDLKSLHYQRDKSARIYEAIRDSLPDIQFYDTVTNLKLETADGRLHVHVTEDVNEIIPYPSISAINHLEYRCFKERDVDFDSHISGFVYKVGVRNRTYIKKEIPGPDAVEEFLYEINALSTLQDSKSVIQFEGVIVDETGELIKGLLISYAREGALVDMIYDFKHQLAWERREKWARQIVEGLSEIHEAGFVQGDFTLSNIVVDGNDDAKIIDINRRGCPVGWEPPELARLIESGQRISIYIGVKSDLFQLGMVLWALAEQQDEPERQDRPLIKTLNRLSNVPEYFKDLVRACLSDKPRNRLSAKELLGRFPEIVEVDDFKPRVAIRDSLSSHRSDKEYIDPKMAVDHNDIKQHRQHSQHSRPKLSFENVNVPSTEYVPSAGSYILPNNEVNRGRSPDHIRSRSRHRQSDYSPYPGHQSIMSLDDSELDNDLASLPASRETRWEQVYVDGDTKLVQRGGGEAGMHDFANQDAKQVFITPSALENSFMEGNDNTPLSLSTIADAPPKQSQLKPIHGQDDDNDRKVASRSSFSDRVHLLAQTQGEDAAPKQHEDTGDPQRQALDPNFLAELEQEFEYDSAPSSLAPSRVGTGFSIFDRPERNYRIGTGFTTFSAATNFTSPLRQDTGFAEPSKNPQESWIRKSLDESVRDVEIATGQEETINTTLWEAVHDTAFGFGEGIRGSQLQLRREDPHAANSTSAVVVAANAHPSAKPDASTPPLNHRKEASDLHPPSDRLLEEKMSNTTIRPPTIPPTGSTFQENKITAHDAPQCSSAVTPPHHNTKTVFEPPATPQYEHEYFQRLRTNSDLNSKRSRDLDDYLNSEIE
ncbi:protein kinase domain-containing protein [Stagonosporopsis vannaccii]|nr:protein kinase domain-containing protein [Stagonosporopsis vannaccii]